MIVSPWRGRGGNAIRGSSATDAEAARREAHVRTAWLCGGCGSQLQSPRHDTRCITCDSTHAAIDRAILTARVEGHMSGCGLCKLFAPAGKCGIGDRLRRELEALDGK